MLCRLIEGLTLGLAGSGGGSSSAELRARNLACLHALIAAAMFLAGPRWFAALEVLQNAGYVLTTRGTSPPGSAALSPKTGVTSGTPIKRGGTLADGLAGSGQHHHHHNTTRTAAAIEATNGTCTSGRPRPGERSSCDPAAFRCERHSGRFRVP